MGEKETEGSALRESPSKQSDGVKTGNLRESPAKASAGITEPDIDLNADEAMAGGGEGRDFSETNNLAEGGAAAARTNLNTSRSNVYRSADPGGGSDPADERSTVKSSKSNTSDRVAAEAPDEGEDAAERSTVKSGKSNSSERTTVKSSKSNSSESLPAGDFDGDGAPEAAINNLHSNIKNL